MTVLLVVIWGCILAAIAYGFEYWDERSCSSGVNALADVSKFIFCVYLAGILIWVFILSFMWAETL